MYVNRASLALSVICMTALEGYKAFATPLLVSFDPSTSIVNLGDTFTVSLVADIPDPVLGWGLDVSFDPALLALDPATGVTIGPDWFPAFAPDGDNLAGLAFPEVSGSNVLLADLTFTALAAGATSLAASFTAGDFTEGFPLSSGDFADVAFVGASINIAGTSAAPEPATLLLSGIGILGLGMLRRQKVNRAVRTLVNEAIDERLRRLFTGQEEQK